MPRLLRGCLPIVLVDAIAQCYFRIRESRLPRRCARRRRHHAQRDQTLSTSRRCGCYLRGQETTRVSAWGNVSNSNRDEGWFAPPSPRQSRRGPVSPPPAFFIPLLGQGTRPATPPSPLPPARPLSSLRGCPDNQKFVVTTVTTFIKVVFIRSMCTQYQLELL